MKDTYAWIIDRDHLSGGDDSDAGTVGPRFAPDSLLADLKAGKGTLFRLFDDDGELYYSGRIVFADPDEGVGLEPLDDYGAPNAGCTTMHAFERGVWVEI